MKKVLSFVLVLALVLAVAVPAFAAAEGSNKLEQSTKYTGTTEVATIAIVVPASGSFVVNPYKMTLENIDGVTGDALKAQVVSAPVQVVNNSTLAMQVKGTVTGTIAGNAKFAVGNEDGDALTETEAGQNAVLLQFKISAPKAGGTAAAVATAQETVTVKASAVKFGEVTDDYAGITLAAAGTGATNAIDVQFGGIASDAPKTPWTAADKVSATVAYTFTPVANTVAAP